MSPTPHIKAEKGEIAKIVIMPGDPLRAKLIAETYLEDVKMVNDVRNMFAYTGKYKGKELTVMGSGMGVASIGIYSYELYKFYDVETIMRIGTAGGFSEKVDLGDIVVAQAACTNSNYSSQYKLVGSICPIADFDLIQKAHSIIIENNLKPIVGNILTSDTFYTADEDQAIQWKNMGVLAVEMEAAALYLNAMYLNKKALAMCTISDMPLEDRAMSSDERLNSLHNMIKVSLEMALKL